MGTTSVSFVIICTTTWSILACSWGIEWDKGVRSKQGSWYKKSDLMSVLRGVDNEVNEHLHVSPRRCGLAWTCGSYPVRARCHTERWNNRRIDTLIEDLFDKMRETDTYLTVVLRRSAALWEGELNNSSTLTVCVSPPVSSLAHKPLSLCWFESNKLNDPKLVFFSSTNSQKSNLQEPLLSSNEPWHLSRTLSKSKKESETLKKSVAMSWWGSKQNIRKFWMR